MGESWSPYDVIYQPGFDHVTGPDGVELRKLSGCTDSVTSMADVIREQMAAWNCAFLAQFTDSDERHEDVKPLLKRPVNTNAAPEVGHRGRGGGRSRSGAR